ncbi:MAG: AbrB family transcriptional regulator [Lysobacterales bacterium CG17_big_fil_post_rev_8_21_14_2_50_64_11]|nr:MAG: AbrB family transcriptional regulator [Xanthomonadales bacterium CG17_big_fil_post_rev_8_21_14_2_50_64_11]
MLATITSKGQLTLPKEIRDQLGLVAGSKLDFSIEADGSLRVRPLRRGAADLFGLLHDPDRAASTVEQMNEAVGQYLAEDDERIRGSSNTSATKRKVRR